MDNKSFWRWCHVGEWVACDEGQFRITSAVEDLYITRINDLDRFNHISKRTVGSRQDYAIRRPHVAQRAKKSVTMSGDADIPCGSRQRSTVDVAGSHSKSFRSSAFQNHHRNMKARNLDSSDRVSRMRWKNNDGMWKRSSTRWFGVPFLLGVDQPTRRSLRAERIQAEAPIPRKSECAPDQEGAPEIDQ